MLCSVCASIDCELERPIVWESATACGELRGKEGDLLGKVRQDSDGRFEGRDR